jgi:UDP-N-acetylglucosamine 2-epimerase
LLNNAAFIITDSGGVQQEAAIFKTPALTLRENTEWVETMECGINRLVDVNTSDFADQLASLSADQGAKKALDAIKIPFELGAAEKSLAILCALKKQGRLNYRTSNFFIDKN